MRGSAVPSPRRWPVIALVVALVAGALLGSVSNGSTASAATGASISGALATGNTATAYKWDATTGIFSSSAYSAIAAGGIYTITGVPEGKYLLRFSGPAGSVAQYWTASRLIVNARSVVVTAADASSGATLTGYDGAAGASAPRVSRNDGASRYASNANASALAFPSAKTIVVANGENFPDATSAGPLAAALGAPLILVHPTVSVAETNAEIARLNPTLIVAVGGTASLPDATLNALKAQTTSGRWERIDGADRYAMSRAVASYGFAGHDNTTAYIVNGASFPDGLVATAAAANEFAPVILDTASGTLDPATSTLLQTLKIEKVVVVGSTTSIPASTATALAAVPGVTSVTRVQGADRYATSVAVNARSFQVADTVFITTGLNYPDGLGAASTAGLWRSPIYLAQPHCVPLAVIEDINRLAPRTIYILGGQTSLAASVELLTPC